MRGRSEFSVTTGMNIPVFIIKVTKEWKFAVSFAGKTDVSKRERVAGSVQGLLQEALYG